MIDLPGTYSLISLDLAEAETRNFLLEGQVNAVLNVIDASLLSRSLELTLQLLRIESPMVVCLNMEDETKRKDHYLNLGFFPITWALGLPLSLGVTLIFGVFRKELSLIMLFQALGTTQVATVLSAGQMMAFTCLCSSTSRAWRRSPSLYASSAGQKAALVIASTTGIALVVALLARRIAGIIG